MGTFTDFIAPQWVNTDPALVNAIETQRENLYYVVGDAISKGSTPSQLSDGIGGVVGCELPVVSALAICEAIYGAATTGEVSDGLEELLVGVYDQYGPQMSPPPVDLSGGK